MPQQDVDNNVWTFGDGDGDGDVLRAGAIELRVLHTPGHSPGSSCLYDPELQTVFTRDTLFQGGPGATGRSFSSFDPIIASNRERLLTLPGDTTAHRARRLNLISAEAPQLMWIARGSDGDGCRETRSRANAKTPQTAEGRPVRPTRVDSDMYPRGD